VCTKGIFVDKKNVFLSSRTRVNTLILGLMCACTVAVPTSSADTPKRNTTLEGVKVNFQKDCRISTARPSVPEASATDSGGSKEFAFLIPLVTAVLPELVSWTTKWLDDSLTKRGNEFSSTFSSTNVALVSEWPDGVLGCVIIARGTFAPAPTIASKRRDPSDTVWTDATLTSAGLADAPAFYMEAWLRYADPGRTAVVLTPVLLDYSSTSAKRTSKNEKKDIVVTVAFSQVAVPKSQPSEGATPSPPAKAPPTPSPAPAPTPSEKSGGSPPATTSPAPKPPAPKPGSTTTNAPSTDSPPKTTSDLAFVFAFPNTPISTRLTESVLRDVGVQAQAATQLNIPGASALSDAPSVDATGKIKISKESVRQVPMNLSVTVGETEDGGDTYLSLGKFVADSKATVDPQLTSLIQKLFGQTTTPTASASGK
jgi:hypothetical protein